jgi:hypothetical protein
MQTQSAASTKQTDRRALSPLKHGLTGRIYLLSQAEQMAYDELTRGLHQDLAPAGEMEMQLVQALVDDRWRLTRANCLEASLFCEGAERFADSPEATGDGDVDLALSEGRVWQAEAKNLNLLSLYESRIHRRFEKNFAILRKLQADRKAALEQAIQEAALLSQLAESEGEPCDPAEPFERRNFVFSTAEIGQMVSRYRRLEEAKKLSKAPRKPLRAAA